MNPSVSDRFITPQPLPRWALAAGSGMALIGGAGLVLSYLLDHCHAAMAILLLFVGLTSVGVGSLFLIALESLTGAVWSIPFRRISEFFSTLVWPLPILAAILFIIVDEVFQWTSMGDLGEKARYLNLPFFKTRTAIILAAWILFHLLLTKISSKPFRKRISACFMLMLAIGLTTFAIDWIMALTPRWTSTIFGIYVFSGLVVGALSVQTFSAVLLKKASHLPDTVSGDHFYNLGALIFAFNCFWAYIGFSQIMLIWAANLPQETAFFLDRLAGGWLFIFGGLVTLHFLIPFFGLLSRNSKMSLRRLLLVSACSFLAHTLDLYWLIMPTRLPSPIFGLAEVSVILSMVGLLLLTFSLGAKRNPLLQADDPKLSQALDFHL